jgi:hypothetical protein
MTDAVTHDEWVQHAIDAAVQQGFGVAVEDPEALDFVADVFATAERRSDPTTN